MGQNYQGSDLFFTKNRTKVVYENFPKILINLTHNKIMTYYHLIIEDYLQKLSRLQKKLVKN